MSRNSDLDEMKKNYNFTGGIRGKYAKRYHQSVNIIVLDPDVAEHFPNAESVNQALRTVHALKHGADKGA